MSTVTSNYIYIGSAESYSDGVNDYAVYSSLEDIDINVEGALYIVTEDGTMTNGSITATAEVYISGSGTFSNVEINASSVELSDGVLNLETTANSNTTINLALESVVFLTGESADYSNISFTGSGKVVSTSDLEISSSGVTVITSSSSSDGLIYSTLNGVYQTTSGALQVTYASTNASIINCVFQSTNNNLTLTSSAFMSTTRLYNNTFIANGTLYVTSVYDETSQSIGSSYVYADTMQINATISFLLAGGEINSVVMGDDDGKYDYTQTLILSGNATIGTVSGSSTSKAVTINGGEITGGIDGVGTVNVNVSCELPDITNVASVNIASGVTLFLTGDDYRNTTFTGSGVVFIDGYTTLSEAEAELGFTFSDSLTFAVANIYLNDNGTTKDGYATYNSFDSQSFFVGIERDINLLYNSGTSINSSYTTLADINLIFENSNSADSFTGNSFEAVSMTIAGDSSIIEDSTINCESLNISASTNLEMIAGSVTMINVSGESTILDLTVGDDVVIGAITGDNSSSLILNNSITSEISNFNSLTLNADSTVSNLTSISNVVLGENVTLTLTGSDYSGVAFSGSGNINFTSSVTVGSIIGIEVEVAEGSTLTLTGSSYQGTHFSGSGTIYVECGIYGSVEIATEYLGFTYDEGFDIQLVDYSDITKFYINETGATMEGYTTIVAMVGVDINDKLDIYYSSGYFSDVTLTTVTITQDSIEVGAGLEIIDSTIDTIYLQDTATSSTQSIAISGSTVVGKIIGAAYTSSDDDEFALYINSGEITGTITDIDYIYVNCDTNIDSISGAQNIKVAEGATLVINSGDYSSTLFSGDGSFVVLDDASKGTILQYDENITILTHTTYGDYYIGGSSVDWIKDIYCECDGDILVKNLSTNKIT